MGPTRRSPPIFPAFRHHRRRISRIIPPLTSTLIDLSLSLSLSLRSSCRASSTHFVIVETLSKLSFFLFLFPFANKCRKEAEEERCRRFVAWSAVIEETGNGDGKWGPVKHTLRILQHIAVIVDDYFSQLSYIYIYKYIYTYIYVYIYIFF